MQVRFATDYQKNGTTNCFAKSKEIEVINIQNNKQRAIKKKIPSTFTSKQVVVTIHSKWYNSTDAAEETDHSTITDLGGKEGEEIIF